MFQTLYNQVPCSSPWTNTPHIDVTSNYFAIRNDQQVYSQTLSEHVQATHTRIHCIKSFQRVYFELMLGCANHKCSRLDGAGFSRQPNRPRIPEVVCCVSVSLFFRCIFFHKCSRTAIICNLDYLNSTNDRSIRVF